MTEALKDQVRDFWDRMSCGEIYAMTDGERLDLERQEAARYQLEPYLPGFARFEDGTARDVLEIGVGMGADHARWAASSPRSLAGVDLTDRAVAFTRSRLAAAGLSSDLRRADAEALPFADKSFDIVYSWGVMHHSPDTQRCLSEARRVLRPGGAARIMVYHDRSLVGAMLWLRYGLLIGRPRTALADLYARHLESPGTKAYSAAAMSAMLERAGFGSHSLRVQLSHGDLLRGAVGQRHPGVLLSLAKRLWPSWLLSRVAGRFGLYLLIEARR